MKEYAFDERRKIALSGNETETLEYAVKHWIACAQAAIQDHGFFAVALSGGSTPKKIYQLLSSSEHASKVDWSKVFLFWSDERSVSPDDAESNYHMAMVEGGLKRLPIPPGNIFRMVAENDQVKNAENYEKTIREKLQGKPFDLIMLGMGEDGHTASLFPHTSALSVEGKLVVANPVPQKKTLRMTFTYAAINAARNICFYVIGAAKAEILAQVLTSSFQPLEFPSQKVGTPQQKALWIVDEAASRNLLAYLK